MGLLVPWILILNGCFAGRYPVELDKELGNQVNRQVVEQIGLYQDTKAGQYVQSIGERLVGNLGEQPFQFVFNLSDQAEPNAFALPGGYIYVSRGLMVLANSEDELAGVIGHEIIHVTGRHAIRQMQKGIIPGILSIPGKIVGNIVSKDVGTLLNAPINSAGSLMLASFSRGHENEADRLGASLAAKSGYDPRALAVILGQLEKAADSKEGKARKFSFFDSHPMTPDRLEKIERDADSTHWTRTDPVARDRSDFLGRMDGIAVEEDPALGVFRGRQFLHPDLNFTLTFPEGWKTMNTPSAVGAFADKKEGFAVLGIAGKDPDPDKLAQSFIDRVKNEQKTEPTEVRTVEFGEWRGTLVTYTDKTGREPMAIHILWVRMGPLTYELIGIGPEKFREALKQTAMSLRPMTQEEHASITVNRLRSAESRDGETLEEFGRRTDNAWSVPYTAIVNGLSEEGRLPAGKLIKISHREPYVPDPQ